MRIKAFFLTTFGLFLLILLFWGVYNIRFRENPNTPNIPKETTSFVEEKTTSPFDVPVASKKITSLLNERVLGASASDQGIFYYSLDENVLKKASLEGKDKSILLSNLPGVPTRILWSPKNDKVLLFLKKESGASLWHFADITTRTLTPLKPEISRIAWDAFGEKILYQYTDPKNGERTLNIANPDGGDWKTLVKLGNKDHFLSPIPRSVSVAYWNKPNALETTKLGSIGLSGEGGKTLFSGKYGADYQFAPDGRHILASFSDKEHPEKIGLFIINSDGGELRSLEAPTIINKAVWASDGETVFYALPSGIPENALLPNDYFEKNLRTQDTFWKLNTVTGKKSRLVELSELGRSFDATDLFLSPKENSLFFTNREDQKLYMIEL